MMTRKIVRASTKIVLLALPILLTVWVFNSVNWSAQGPGGYVNVTIPQGKNTGQIGKTLQDKGVIKNATLFRIYASYLGVSDKLVAGRYRFPKNSGLKEVIDILVQGPQEESFWVTLPEGITRKRIGEKIDGIGELDTNEFLDLTKRLGEFDHPFIRQDIGSLEGYLFPETYRVYSDTTTKQFIKMLLDQFNSKTSSLSWKIAEEKQLTKHDIITLASLIERETKLPAERPIVAAVIYNRLKIGMPLQIDATVQYALPKWKKALTYNDLKVDSPYNTYTKKGLPPGPIANPGIESIKAALNPASNDFLYYVLIDKSGRHAFARTYPEFLKLKTMRPR